jgi:hypothetical protein
MVRCGVTDSLLTVEGYDVFGQGAEEGAVSYSQLMDGGLDR